MSNFFLSVANKKGVSLREPPKSQELGAPNNYEWNSQSNDWRSAEMILDPDWDLNYSGPIQNPAPGPIFGTGGPDDVIPLLDQNTAWVLHQQLSQPSLSLEETSVAETQSTWISNEGGFPTIALGAFPELADGPPATPRNARE